MLTREDFIKKYGGYVRSITAGTGIFPETLFAQAIVESQGKVNGKYYPGESSLAKKYGNYFGIKANSAWHGPSVNLSTGEVFNGVPTVINANFRVYPGGFEESAKDYVNFLKKNERYTKAGVFSAPDYREQIARIHSAGYATALSYTQVVGAVADYVNRVLLLFPHSGGAVGLALIIGLTILFFTK